MQIPFILVTLIAACQINVRLGKQQFSLKRIIVTIGKPFKLTEQFINVRTHTKHTLIIS